jgi:hypothetical protein
MSQKTKLAEKVKAFNPDFTIEQAIQIAHFLLTLSEVYYEMEAKEKLNQKNKAA